MATKTLAKKQPVKTEEKTMLESIDEAVDKHISAIDAILEDYSYWVEEGMVTEVNASNENLRNAISDITEAEESFEALLKKVKQHTDYDHEEVLELVDIEEIDHMELLEKVGDDFIKNWAIEQGYALVKVPQLDQRNKLEEFLNTEIHPLYSDQQMNIII